MYRMFHPPHACMHPSIRACVQGFVFPLALDLRTFVVGRGSLLVRPPNTKAALTGACARRCDCGCGRVATIKIVIENRSTQSINRSINQSIEQSD
jgi:hypothetical protein